MVGTNLMNNPIVVITGVTSGIGKDALPTLAKMGFSLIIVGRNLSRLDKLIKRLESRYSIDIWQLENDLTEPNSLETNLSSLIESKKLNIYALINNAGGVAKSLTFDETVHEDWSTVWLLNVMSCVHLTKAVLPSMRRQNFGRIINISSINAKNPGHFNPHYCASKAALNNLTKYLSKYYAKYNILVNSISPGIIDTEGFRKNLLQDINDSQKAEENFEKRLKDVRTRIPLNRLGSSNDVISLITYLLDPQNAYVTGSDFVVDGGKLPSL